MRSVAVLFWALLLTLPCGGQSSAPASIDDAAKVNVRHERAAALVRAMGAREALEANRDKIVQTGADAMRQNNSSFDPAFVDEWTKRMRTRFNADDYVAVMTGVYAAHFTAEELQAFMDAQPLGKGGKGTPLGEAVKARFTSESVAIQSEILGGCAQVGARIGGEIGQEIQREHPEWIKVQTSSPPPK